ncbi:MAG: hypothetical protein N2B03_02895 [Boseongicola sp.]
MLTGPSGTAVLEPNRPPDVLSHLAEIERAFAADRLHDTIAALENYKRERADRLFGTLPRGD